MLKNKFTWALGLAFCLSFNLQAQEDFRKQAPKPGPAPTIEIGDSETFKLDNGLTVILVENDKLPRVSFQLTVDVPDFSEGDKAGYSSIAGDLMGRGTKSRTKAQIDESVDFIGANFGTSSAGMFGSCLTKNADALLEIMSDVLMNPTFPEEEFEKIKKTTLSGIAQTQNSPDAIMSNIRRKIVYGDGHPFADIETEATINNISVSDCTDYYTTYFKPNISYLVIVGDMGLKAAKQAANKYFGAWKSGAVPAVKPVKVPQPEGVQVVFVDQPGAVQSTVAVCYPVAYNLNSSDYITGSLMSTFFGGYFGSRLNQNLREDKAYTYGARGGLRANDLVGNFVASASVRNEVSDSSVTEMLFEMNRMINEPLTSKELSVVKNYRTGNFAIGLENPRTVATFALNVIRNDLDEDFYSNYLKELNGISIADMSAASKKYLNPNDCYVIVVGNKSEVAKTLTKFDSDGQVDFYDAYGNEIKSMDMPVNVTAQTVVEDYIAAIGGQDKLDAVDYLAVSRVANSPMGELEVYELSSKQMNKVESFAMGGNVLNKKVIYGDQGYVLAQGQKVNLKPDELATEKMNATPFAELSFFDNEIYSSVQLSGVEQINEEEVYRIDLERVDGIKMSAFYGVNTGLKVRTVVSIQGQLVTTDYASYKDTDGILFPASMTVSGPFPMPLELVAKTIEVNPTNTEALFK